LIAPSRASEVALLGRIPAAVIPPETVKLFPGSVASTVNAAVRKPEFPNVSAPIMCGASSRTRELNGVESAIVMLSSEAGGAGLQFDGTLQLALVEPVKSVVWADALTMERLKAASISRQIPAFETPRRANTVPRRPKPLFKCFMGVF
jgi:hypothetical protein